MEQDRPFRFDYHQTSVIPFYMHVNMHALYGARPYGSVDRADDACRTAPATHGEAESSNAIRRVPSADTAARYKAL